MSVPSPLPAKSKQSAPPHDGHPIEAERSVLGTDVRTLKHDDLFAVLDVHGDVGVSPGGAEGVYFRDMRHLSACELHIEGVRPLLLGSVLLDDNVALSVDMANPDIHAPSDGGTALAKDVIHLTRLKFVRAGVLYERIGLRSFEPHRRKVRIALRMGADFSDIFEIRGERRPVRGQIETIVRDDGVIYRYRGVDGLERQTEIAFAPAPARVGRNGASWEISLTPRRRTMISVTIACSHQERAPARPARILYAYRRAHQQMRAAVGALRDVSSSSELFDSLIARSAYDLGMLLTRTDDGPYPYGGLPWFSTVFGRDGLLTAMQLLWLEPRVAQGVLGVLARTQSTGEDAPADAQAGKILHELRDGEMARTGEVPFRRYYGSVDATPLFVQLAGLYYRRTGDLQTVRRLWPNIEAALNWIDRDGDADGDGFVEYSRTSEDGLVNQGWKDSDDSVFHADGSLARGPIALCEVQAYVYAAKRLAAELARALGHADRAARLADQAERLRRDFEAAFWDETLGSYVLALDGEKRPCAVRASNAGHALFCGIADPDRARSTAATLLSERCFSGWGVRTIATGERRYNPMSYHNGSIWPHDNALIAAGLARYQLKDEALRIFEGIFTAGAYQGFRRLPELFCGFARRQDRGPTAYPVACSPQAWAAASPFALLAASLGIEVDGRDEAVKLRLPRLPPFIDRLVISNLQVASSRLTLELTRTGDSVAVHALEREGPARLVVEK